MMFDIGVNLTSSQLVDDAPGVLERAVAAGVTGIAITGTSARDSVRAVELCRQLQGSFPGVICATAGVHPHHASEWSDAVRDQILTLCKDTHIVAVGETGLDFNRNFSTKSQQLVAFEEQILLAIETGLPLFLHERDAFEVQIGLLRKYRDQFSDGVAHCFTGTQDQLQAYLDLGLYIGITGWVCDERRGKELASLVKDIPLERLLIETDAPWLLPRNMQPKPQGRNNEPAYLGWVSKAVAQCYGIDDLDVREQTTKNALRLFRINR